MKTNIGIETTDEEREKISYALNLTKKWASRDDIRAAVNEFIADLKKGNRYVEQNEERPPELVPTLPAKVQEFAPSRGDESYLAQPKDPGIAAACSRILDDAALIEQFAWDTIERNRK